MADEPESNVDDTQAGTTPPEDTSTEEIKKEEPVEAGKVKIPDTPSTGDKTSIQEQATDKVETKEETTEETKEAVKEDDPELKVPKTPEEYEFPVPDDLPEGFQYDEAAATQFRNAAHEAGLSQKAAKAILDNYVEQQVEIVKQQIEHDAGRETTAHDNLVKSWGAPESDGFKKNLNDAVVAMQKWDLIDEFKEAGLISPDGFIRSEKLAKAMAQGGRQLFAEDSSVLPQTKSGQTTNYFKKETRNYSKMAELVSKAKDDPAVARVIRPQITSAGFSPSEFGL